MTNEVTKETEEAVKPEESVEQETKTETPAEKSAEVTSTAKTEEPAETTPTEEKAVEATPEKEVEPPVAKAEENNSIAVKTEEDNSSSNHSSAPAVAETGKVGETTATETSVEEPSANDAANEIDFGAILEEFEQDQEEYHPGKLVEGKVVGISEREVLVNFGYKSEGVVPSDEFVSLEGEVNLKVGDEVEVVIKNIYSGDSPPVLSRLDAIHRKSWDAIEQAFNEETIVTGKVFSKTKGGLKVDIEGVEAFLPGSQVDSRPIRNLDSFIGEEIEAKVIKFSRKRNNIVISRKVLTDQVINKLKAETLSQIEEQYVVDGVIKNLTEYGAFVDLGGIDGLLHVTDMSWGRLQNPNELFKVNDNVQVKILKLDREKEKVSLGYKQLFPDPWSTVVEVYPVDSVIEGRISSVTDYGAFVELEPGVEGLVHVSEMSWSKRTKNPKKLMRSGDEVKVQVLGIDTEERRISLGMKQLQENPWETIAERYQVGSKIKGKVRNLTDFGAFVEVEEGVDGLVHVSDISHSKKIKHPKDVLKRDQEVEAIVTNIDTEGHRLSLSIKELTPSAWDAFVEKHNPGDVVKGKVSRFAGFGVFVELGDDLEGLCHISELADERVEKPEDVVSIGQELDFKILRIEHDVQKIGLSARAVGKEDEPHVDSRQYSTEAKGGMASLGELINLKHGNQEAAEEEEEKPKLSKKERRAIRAKEKAEAQDETVTETESKDEVTAETEVIEEPKAEEATGDEEAKVEESKAEETAEVKEEAAPEEKEEAVKEEKSAETEEKADEKAEAVEEETVVDEKTDPEAEAETPEAEVPKEEKKETAEVKAETDNKEEEAQAAESADKETASEEPKESSEAESDEGETKAEDDGKSDAEKTETAEADGKSDADKTETADDGKSDADKTETAEDDGKSDADKTETSEDDGKSDADKTESEENSEEKSANS